MGRNSVEKSISDLFQSFDMTKNQWLVLYCVLLAPALVFSFFGYPTHDATLYLRETNHMAQLLSSGVWVGNEPVGTHGFLFKLPVAIAFIFTGPSLFVAHLFHITVAFFTLFFFGKIARFCFKENVYAVLALLLFVSSYIFLKSSSSYNREAPVLFASVLFIYALLKKKNAWVVGMTILLMLDAKEHVFFQFGLGVFAWSIYDIFIRSKIFSREEFLLFVRRNFAYFFPSFVYICLMFFTPIIPFNPFLGAILMLVEKGSDWMALHFITHGASTDIDFSGAENGASSNLLSFAVNFNLYRSIDDFIQLFGCQAAKAEEVRNIFCRSYYAKLLMPRFLSYLSLPKIIAVPGLIFPFLYMKENSKAPCQAKDHMVMLGILVWAFFLLFFLRASHGRYLLSATPILILCFLFFVRMTNLKGKQYIFWITLALIVLSMLFEIKYFFPKVFIHIITLFLFYKVLAGKKNVYKIAFYTSLALFMFTTHITSSYCLVGGRLRNYLIHGYAGEMDEVATIAQESNGPIYVNICGSDKSMLEFYTDKKVPSQFRSETWKIREWLPKRNMIKSYPSSRFKHFNFEEVPQFVGGLRARKIHKVLFAVSKNEDKKYYNQDLLCQLKSNDNLKLKNRYTMKNKTIYLFDVTGVSP